MFALRSTGVARHMERIWEGVERIRPGEPVRVQAGRRGARVVSDWPKKGSHSWAAMDDHPGIPGPKGPWSPWQGWFRCIVCDVKQPPEDEGDERDEWNDENVEETCGFRQVKKIQES